MNNKAAFLHTAGRECPDTRQKQAETRRGSGELPSGRPHSDRAGGRGACAHKMAAARPRPQLRGAPKWRPAARPAAEAAAPKCACARQAPLPTSPPCRWASACADETGAPRSCQAARWLCFVRVRAGPLWKGPEGAGLGQVTRAPRAGAVGAVTAAPGPEGGAMATTVSTQRGPVSAARGLPRRLPFPGPRRRAERSPPASSQPPPRG